VPPPPGPSWSQWSTSAVPARDQFTYWREMICEAFLDLTPQTRQRGGFRGRVVQQALGPLDLAGIDSQAQHVQRTEADIARAPRHGYYANLQVRGSSLTSQDGRRAVLRPGDLTLVHTARPFTMDFDGDFRQLSLHVPGPLLEAQLDAPPRTATRIDTTAGVGAAVRHALGAIVRNELHPDAAATLAVHTAGLLAVALDRPAPPEPGRVRGHERLLAAARADIEEHLTDDDLSPTTTASRLGISVRLLHQVFAGAGGTYTTRVRDRRLDKAHRDLLDPAMARLRVIDVAAEAGFADVTHFHRAFRRRYGCTPGTLRRRDGG